MRNSRVTVGHGVKPLLLVAPHGNKADDYNTDLITERTANLLQCNYVINHGWKKFPTLDLIEEKADCNNYDHMKDDVKKEFLNPIVQCVNTVLKFYPKCYIIWIHGVSNKVRAKYKKNNIEMIFGDGESKSFPDRSCNLNLKRFIICNLIDCGVKCYSSFPGDQYNGASFNNMNKYFSNHNYNPRVESCQLEIVKDLRGDKVMSTLTSHYLFDALEKIDEYEKNMPPINSSYGTV
jgi:hypothetical protein